MKNVNYYDDFVCLTPAKDKSSQSTSSKDGRVNIRMRKIDYRLIMDAARIKSYPSVAQFIREAAINAANEVIDEYNNMIMAIPDGE